MKMVSKRSVKEGTVGESHQKSSPCTVCLDQLNRVELDLRHVLNRVGVTESTRGAKTICGGYEYLAVAPEILKERNTALQQTGGRFGAVLYEVLTGLPPWYS